MCGWAFPFHIKNDCLYCLYCLLKPNPFLLGKGLKTIETIETIFYKFVFTMEIISSKRRRRRRISITAGWAAEGSEACGHMNDRKSSSKRANIRGIFTVYLCSPSSRTFYFSCYETAGYVRFALFTSGYGYSPSSRTLAWDSSCYIINAKVSVKDCLYCLYCL